MIKFLIKLYNKLFKNKHRTILVWSADSCRIDEKGGPYKVKIYEWTTRVNYQTTGYSYDASVNNNLTLSFWYKSTTAGNFIFPLSIKTDGGIYNSSIVMVYNKKLLIQDRTGWVLEALQ